MDVMEDQQAPDLGRRAVAAGVDGRARTKKVDRARIAAWSDVFPHGNLMVTELPR